jgi:hypothetical protein
MFEVFIYGIAMGVLSSIAFWCFFTASRPCCQYEQLYKSLVAAQEEVDDVVTRGKRAMREIAKEWQ